MPIRPEEIDPSKLPVGLRGYDREATDELLKRVAWDYRQALRGHEDRAENDRRLAARIEELEARLASQHAEFASAIAGRDERVDTDAAHRIASLEAEVALVRRKLAAHESRAELTRILLHTAQKAARDIRESARQDAVAALRAAQRK